MGVITTATGEELLQMLIKLDADYAGMTTAEAAAALGLKTGAKIASSYSVIAAPGEAIVSDTATAVEAYNAYVAAGGAVGTGEALSQSAAAAASVAEIAPAVEGGAATVGGILSMSVPAAAAAIAPLLGVAIGAGLYELAPEFWTKISNALLPFCNTGTETIPFVVDKNGQAYIDSGAVEALKTVFDSIQHGAITDPSFCTAPSPIPYVTASVIQLDRWYNGNVVEKNTLAMNTPVHFFNGKTTANNMHVSFISKNPFTGITTRQLKDDSGNWYVVGQSQNISGVKNTIKNKDFYLSDSQMSSTIKITYPNMPDYTSGDVDIKKIAWTIEFGEQSNPYPGITSYTGNTPVDYTQNKIDVVTDPTDLTIQPYYPIRIPIGDPGVTTSPLVNPNPQSPNTAPEITPYVSPEVSPLQYPNGVPVPSTKQRTAPLENPVPNINPIIEPSTDPSSPPTDIPPAIPNSTTSPTSDGTSPSTTFPPIGTWPSIVPSGDSGLIHVYNPTSDEMIAFGKWLWVTYADSTIEKIWNNPFDGVISAHELYATPATDGSDNIRSGFLVCPTTAPLVRVRYTTINCGSIAIPEHYSNYLDYSPYSKAHVYLPFIGIVELNVDDIVGHGVNITYHIDAYNGSCIAQITVAKKDYTNTIYQYSGNCAVDLPLSGGSQAAIKAGMIAAAATGISSIIGSVASGVTGNIGGAISGAAYGASSALVHAVSQKSSVQHSGSFGTSYGAMGIKNPYIIIHRPIQKEVVNYNLDYGYPAHKMVTIGTCSGYLRVREVNVTSQTATDDEKALIEKKLKEGVYVS